MIIPVFNCEKYLLDCIKSIINQSYPYFEAIFIDDGSTDDSLKILNEWLKNDERIKVVSQKNSGVSCARNVGIDKAKFEYILFIDSDDVLNDKALEYYNFLINNHSGFDMIQTKLLRFENPNSEELLEINFQDKLNDVNIKNSIVKLIIADTTFIENTIFPGPVCKIYKKDILNKYNIRFVDNYFMYEDGIFNLEYLIRCSKAYSSNNVTYYYRYNANSITNRYNPNYMEQRLQMIEYMKKIIVSNNIEICYFHLFIYQSIIDIMSFSIFSRKSNLSIKEKKSIFIDLHNNIEINKYLNFSFINMMPIKKQVILQLYKYKLFCALYFTYRIFKK